MNPTGFVNPPTGTVPSFAADIPSVVLLISRRRHFPSFFKSIPFSPLPPVEVFSYRYAPFLPREQKGLLFPPIAVPPNNQAVFQTSYLSPFGLISSRVTSNPPLLHLEAAPFFPANHIPLPISLVIETLGRIFPPCGCLLRALLFPLLSRSFPKKHTFPDARRTSSFFSRRRILLWRAIAAFSFFLQGIKIPPAFHLALPWQMISY